MKALKRPHFLFRDSSNHLEPKSQIFSYSHSCNREQNVGL